MGLQCSNSVFQCWANFAPEKTGPKPTQSNHCTVSVRDQALFRKDTSKVSSITTPPPVLVTTPPLASSPRRRNPTRLPRPRRRALAMYADRSSGRKRSVRDRLGSGGGSSPRSRPDDAKRYRRADGTRRRELYQDSVGIQSSSELSSRSRQASQKSNLQPSTEVVKKSSIPDLREKLSGVQHPQLNSTIQIPKPAPKIVKTDKPPVQKRETPAAEAPTVPKKASGPAPSAPKLSQEKPDALLDNLLKSLDLEKYLINFQAEEVDMKALIYMNEEDMKSLGIPMGPRKKILQAVAHKKRKSSKSSSAS